MAKQPTSPPWHVHESRIDTNGRLVLVLQPPAGVRPGEQALAAARDEIEAALTEFRDSEGPAALARQRALLREQEALLSAARGRVSQATERQQQAYRTGENPVEAEQALRDATADAERIALRIEALRSAISERERTIGELWEQVSGRLVSRLAADAAAAMVRASELLSVRLPPVEVQQVAVAAHAVLASNGTVRGLIPRHPLPKLPAAPGEEPMAKLRPFVEQSPPDINELRCPDCSSLSVSVSRGGANSNRATLTCERCGRPVSPPEGHPLAALVATGAIDA